MSDTTTTHTLFGELRSLEPLRLGPGDLPGLVDTLDAFFASAARLGVSAEVERHEDALLERAHALYTRVLSVALEARGWRREPGGLFTLEPNRHATLIASIPPGSTSLLTVCAPEPGCSRMRFVELLGPAHGLAQALGMLECVAFEFTTSPREPGGLPDDVVAGELERRRAWVGALDPELFDLPRLMSRVCGHDDYIAWANLNGLDPRRHDPGGEVTSFVDWQGAHAVYTPALSTHGSFGDDCSEIWAAHDLTFPTHDAARAWASAHADRAPAYYRLSAQWRYVCTGKQWGKYA